LSQQDHVRMGAAHIQSYDHGVPRGLRWSARCAWCRLSLWAGRSRLRRRIPPEIRTI